MYTSPEKPKVPIGLSEVNILLEYYKFHRITKDDPLLDMKSFLYRHEFSDYYVRLTGSLREVGIEIFSLSDPSKRQFFKTATQLCVRLENLLDFVRIR